MQKYLQFVFYKFYGYFLKRWPEHDPPDYAQGAIATFLGIDVGIIYLFLIEITGRHDLMEGSSKLFILIPITIVLIFTYWYFLHNDKYREFIKDDRYTNDIYQGWKGTLLIVLFFFITVVMFTLLTLYATD